VRLLKRLQQVTCDLQGNLLPVLMSHGKAEWVSWAVGGVAQLLYFSWEALRRSALGVKPDRSALTGIAARLGPASASSGTKAQARTA